MNFNLLPSLDATENSYNVTSIKGAYGNQVEGKINFTIKNEKEIIEKLHDFTHGKEFGEIELDENILQNVDLLTDTRFSIVYLLYFVPAPPTRLVLFSNILVLLVTEVVTNLLLAYIVLRFVI